MRRILIALLILVSSISVLFNLLNYIQIHNLHVQIHSLQSRVSHVEDQFKPHFVPIAPYHLQSIPAKPAEKQIVQFPLMSLDERAKDMVLRKARYCTNHPKLTAQFYCRNCKQFFCEKCVDEKFAENDFFDACRNCGSRCVEAKWVKLPDSEISGKTPSASFLGLIVHPIETIDSAVENSSYSSILARLLPIFLISLLLPFNRDLSHFPVSNIGAAFQRILFWIPFPMIIIAICRMYMYFVSTVLSDTNERITGWDDILETVLASIYFEIISNLTGFALGLVLPAGVLSLILSYGVGIGCICLFALFIKEIYDFPFLHALVIVWVALYIATFLYLRLLFFGPLRFLMQFGRQSVTALRRESQRWHITLPGCWRYESAMNLLNPMWRKLK